MLSDGGDWITLPWFSESRWQWSGTSFGTRKPSLVIEFERPALLQVEGESLIRSSARQKKEGTQRTSISLTSPISTRKLVERKKPSSKKPDFSSAKKALNFEIRPDRTEILFDSNCPSTIQNTLKFDAPPEGGFYISISCADYPDHTDLSLSHSDDIAFTAFVGEMESLDSEVTNDRILLKIPKSEKSGLKQDLGQLVLMDTRKTGEAGRQELTVSLRTQEDRSEASLASRSSSDIDEDDEEDEAVPTARNAAAKNGKAASPKIRVGLGAGAALETRSRALLTLEADYLFETRSRALLTLEADYLFNLHAKQGYLAALATDFGSRMHRIELYAARFWRISKLFELEAGLRLNHVMDASRSNRTGLLLSPSASLKTRLFSQEGEAGLVFAPLGYGTNDGLWNHLMLGLLLKYRMAFFELRGIHQNLSFIRLGYQFRF